MKRDRNILDNDPRWAGIGAESCYRYTLSRQTPEGGFCFYTAPEWRVAEPNPPDTLAALRILSLLGRPVPRAESCAAWLKEQQESSGGFSTLIIGFAVLKSLRLLGAEPWRNPSGYLEKEGRMLWPADGACRCLAGWLASACRCIALWCDYGIRPTERTRERIASILRKLLNDDGGYGTPGSNLPETAAAVAVASFVDLIVDAKTLVYAQACETTPYGFNITPIGAGSNLETQWAGISVLRRFAAQPRQPSRIRHYVSSCQTAMGGFGRAPGAIALLDDTQRALAILSALPPGGSKANSDFIG